MSPAARKAKAVPLLASYAACWLDDRTLKPTRSHYRKLLDAHVLPTLGGHTLNTITPTLVRTWHAKLTIGPTAKAHAYSLLKTVMHTAVAEDIIPANPCRGRAAGQSKRAVKIKPATLDELTALVAATPERYRAMLLLAAWCGLRFGELAALTRADLDRSNGIVPVRRAVVRVDGRRCLAPRIPRRGSAMRYQHASADRDLLIAERLSALVEGRA